MRIQQSKPQHTTLAPSKQTRRRRHVWLTRDEPVSGPLDPRAAVPPPAGRRVGGRGRRPPPHPVDAQRRRREPANGRQEGKRLVGLPRPAVGAPQAEPAPVKRAPAAAAQPVDNQPEGREPADGQHEVRRPVDEGAREGEQPDDGEEDGESRDDLGVDEAPQEPRRLAVLRVQVVPCDTRDDAGEDELG